MIVHGNLELIKKAGIGVIARNEFGQVVSGTSLPPFSSFDVLSEASSLLWRV